jgi:hypothetical protein
MRTLVKSSVLAVVAFAATAFTQTTPSGELRPDTPADFAPHASTGKTFNEFWTYQFLLNGGIQVQLNLSRANFGSFKDPVCGADLAVMNFMGKNAFVAREYPAKRFSWDAATARLEVHENIWAEGIPPRSHRLFFATQKGGKSYFVDLTFENMLPGAVWGDGVFQLPDNQKMGLYFHIPRGRVKGRLAIDNDTLQVRGFGWLDHTWQTHFGPKLMDAGYRYAITSGRAEGGYFFQKGDKVFGYGIREDKGRLTLLAPVGVSAASRSSWGGMSVPKRLEIALDARAPVALLRTEDRQRTSFMQELSSLERFGAKMFLGGELVGYRGAGLVDDAHPAIFAFNLVKR